LEIGVTTHGAKGNHGYVCESIVGYILPFLREGKAIYRYYNDTISDHIYTTNEAEIGTTIVGAKGNNGYVYEGVLGYTTK